MRFCARCGRSEEEARLFEGIYENESILCCERCSLIDGIILLKKPSVFQLRESERAYPVAKRLEKMAHPESGRKEESVYDELKRLQEKPELEKPEKKGVNLIENFHWHIQRGRRMRKISQEQLAKSLGESEAAIRMLEAGNLPEEHEKLIRKLEQFFQIRLRKDIEPKVEIKRKPVFQSVSSVEEPEIEEIEIPEEKEVLDEVREEMEERAIEKEKIKEEEEKKEKPIRILDFKSKEIGNLTVADLRKMKEHKEEILKRDIDFGVGQDEIMPVEKKEADYTGKTPSIAELVEKKKIEDADKLVGGEIEIDE